MRVDETIRNKDLKGKIIERVAGKVDVQLGKRGVTDSFINELKTRLKKEGVVKVRVLRSFRRTNEVDMINLARTLARETESRIYEVRGFTIILIKGIKSNSVRYQKLA